MMSAGDQRERLQTQTVVQLGFSVEFYDHEHRMSAGHHMPLWRDWDGGQLGGRPSWLNPKDIPKAFMTCKCCQEPLVFVCQLYAPCEEVNPDAFHRSFYVFACPDVKTCGNETTGTIRVLRAQLPRENPYFPEENDEKWSMHLPESWEVNLCKVCGQRGRGKCPIQGHYFCGKHHQKEYKKFVFDKRIQLSGQLNFHYLPSVMTDSELVVEEEPVDDNGTIARGKAENALFKTKGVDTGENVVDSDDDDDEDKNLEQKDLNEMTGAAEETVTKDPFTMKFFDRINVLPNVNTQCLRYLRWPDRDLCLDSGTPLWIRSDCQPPETVPSCERCGADRKFEFQLMPQMLHFLLKDHEVERAKELKSKIKKEDIEAIKTATSIMEQAPPEQVPPEFASNTEKAVAAMRAKLMEEDGRKPDWGMVAVYSCTECCGGMEVSDGSDLGAYIEEYAWKQPSLDWQVDGTTSRVTR